jgi:cytochrome b561
MTSSTAVLVVLVPLIGWRMYSRVRRLVGRQRSRAWRHWTAAILFPLLAALLALPALRDPLALAALAGGLAAGLGLGLWGLGLTRFERTAEGWFYTPNAHIGIALSLLLVARIGWRLFEMQVHGAPARGAQLAASPLTLAIFGTFAGYYASYATGVLRWRRSAP